LNGRLGSAIHFDRFDILKSQVIEAGWHGIAVITVKSHAV